MNSLQRFFIFLTMLYSQTAIAQSKFPSIATEEDNLYIYIEGDKGNFPHKGLESPFHYSLAIESADTISIVSESDSITFIVEPQDSMIFDVVRKQGKDTLHCFFSIIEKQKHANFSEEYKEAHQGKTFVEIPEVYELVNIIYALTPTAKSDPDIVRKSTAYYDEVLTYFTKYSQDPAIRIFDSLLQTGNYHHIKVDAYAFNFKGSIIEKSNTYNIVSWGNVNTLEPYVPLLEAFAKKSSFLRFYAMHKPLYQEQVRTYQDTIDTHEMKVWLERNFPNTKYNSFKVIFSPLVNGNQSSCNFEDNGFKELQAHVNYPYKSQWLQKYPTAMASLIRGDIVFTELNHGYINPESEKPIYSEGIKKAFKDLDAWLEMDKPAGNYASPYACFNEYMNWALVCLRYVDYAKAEDLPDLIANVEKMMVNHRGFIKFPEFDQFLVKLYQNKKEDEVLADLYPQIIAWFGTN